jgi:hypothetical protein
MILFGKLFYGLFGILFTFFARFMVMEKAAKLAQFATFLVMMAAIWQTFMSCAGVGGVCGSTIAAIGSVPTWGQYFMMGLGVIFNNTTYTLASCYLSVWLACNLYIFKKKMWTMLT